MPAFSGERRNPAVEHRRQPDRTERPRFGPRSVRRSKTRSASSAFPRRSGLSGVLKSRVCLVRSDLGHHSQLWDLHGFSRITRGLSGIAVAEPVDRHCHHYLSLRTSISPTATCSCGKPDQTMFVEPATRRLRRAQFPRKRDGHVVAVLSRDCAGGCGAWNRCMRRRRRRTSPGAGRVRSVTVDRHG